MSLTVKQAQDAFALFVRSVEGHSFHRPGTQPAVWLGAIKTPTGWTWTKDIEAITHDEYARYRRDYDKAIRVGALKAFTAEDFVGAIDAEAKGARDAHEAAQKAKLDAAKAEAEAKRAEAQAKRKSEEPGS